MKINYNILLKDLAIILFCIAIPILNLHILTSNLIYVILTTIYLGFWFHALHLFIHEATHYNLHKNKKINEFFGNMLSIFFMGSLLNEYRVKHWQHHKNLGKTTDPENSYFKALNLKNILRYLFLLHIFEKIFFSSNKNKVFTKILSKNHFVILLFISIHGLNLISIFLYTNLIGSIIYLLSFFVCFPFFAVIRQTLEHRSDDTDDHVNYTFEDHGESNRLFNNNFFSRFFGAAGFNKHLLHHLNPNISYTIFDNFEKKLNQEYRFQILMQQNRTSYGETLYKMILKK